MLSELEPFMDEPRKRLLVIGDADVLVAIADPLDDHHARTKKLLRGLIQHRARAFFPITAVCEAITVLQSKRVKRGESWVVRPEEAKYLVEKIQSGAVPLLPISKEMFLLALKTYEQENLAYTIGNTLFDALVAAIANQHRADAVFSFDHWYIQMSLKAAYEVFLEE